MTFHQGVAVALLAATAIFGPAPARAESYHTCTGFIDALPAVISTQGTWCLRKDVSTGLSSGEAIRIETNNVTIECNGYKLGGLAAGASTATFGVFSHARLNHTVRNCNIRGFFIGVRLTGGGHVVEDNRFDANTYMAIGLEGDGFTVRRNGVTDTGGTTRPTYNGLAFGIVVNGPVHILDNTIENVLPNASASGDGSGYGVSISMGPGSMVTGNRIRGIVPVEDGAAMGIYLDTSSRSIIADNHLVDLLDLDGYGIRCNDASSRAVGNVVIGYWVDLGGCTDGGNSL